MIRLKENIRLLADLLRDLDGHNFALYVVSAAPQEVIQSTLEGIIPPERIFGTQFHYHAITGEIESIQYLRAGYGKVAVLEELRAGMAISHNRLVYVGDKVPTSTSCCMSTAFVRCSMVMASFCRNGIKVRTDSLTIARNPAAMEARA